MSYNIDSRMNASGDVFYFIDEIKLSPVGFLSPCAAYNDNIKKMYDQHSRHTEFTLIDTVPGNENTFIKDSINIPAALFETNSAVLKPSFNKVMDDIANRFKSKQILKIDITGYTDNIGTEEKNSSLSLARAKAVKDFIVKKLPQYKDIISVSGKGQEQPIASNATAEGRSKNRRVEIIFTIKSEK
ncbi:MAG: OmpA family protein [Ferruginibacter sp.]